VRRRGRGWEHNDPIGDDHRSHPPDDHSFGSGHPLFEEWERFARGHHDRHHIHQLRRRALRHWGRHAGGPWERVSQEVQRRGPGWRGRIHDEIRLYYGAHLHRRIFFSFGWVILFTVLEIALLNHFLGVSVAGRPWRALLLFGIPTVLLWTASGRLARRMSRPIYELTRVAQKIGGGDLAARASTNLRSSGEVAVLSRAINDMAARIAHQLAEQRELLAAVSHELRTPLSRIRLLIEIAREGRLSPDTLNEIERETVEIDTLVGELLASARLEFQALSTRPLDAVEVARRALDRAGMTVDKLTAPQGPLRFAADPTLVARALANLIDNARKHAGGLDQLSVNVSDGFVIFEVSDRGPGFAPGEEERIFAAFRRGQGSDAGAEDDADASTDRPGRSHGSLGLGLALVKRIAEAHGGDVIAANRAGGGATMTLRLAVTPPQKSGAATSV
jgi:signal transduction histidine kinase